MLSAESIKKAALSVGFSDCGIAQAGSLSENEFPLKQWISAGFHADMHYMEQNVEIRHDPRLLVENAQSVISVILAYKPDRQMEGTYRIAQYAYGEDYHKLMKRMMYQLIATIQGIYSGFEARPFVDTAPISDRHWAVRAGLGWIGKNTLFVSPRFGSYCFIGELVTTAAVDCYDHPMQLSCGDCNQCVNACPNQAIIIPDQAILSSTPLVDARRCTSYNTIENRQERLPDHLDTQRYVFGCDICQIACPYNQQAPAAFTLDDRRKSDLESLTHADEAFFKHFSKNSPINRINYSQWLRNIRKTLSDIKTNHLPTNG